MTAATSGRSSALAISARISFFWVALSGVPSFVWKAIVPEPPARSGSPFWSSSTTSDEGSPGMSKLVVSSPDQATYAPAAPDSASTQARITSQARRAAVLPNRYNSSAMAASLR